MKILKPLDNVLLSDWTGDVTAFAICKNKEDDIVVLFTNPLHGETIYQSTLKYMPETTEDKIMKILEAVE